MTEVRDSLRNRSLAVRPWQEVMPELSSYIKMDRGSNIIFQGILIFLVLFTIFNTILMSVLERQREFAILLAVGTRPLQLRLQILAESAFLGLLGCSVGLLCGALASWLVNYTGFAMSTTLRTRITPQILFTSSAIVFGATLIISLLPMKRAVGVPMADLLR
jgi:ABC-type lipoprotein release transport system permease subunit